MNASIIIAGLISLLIPVAVLYVINALDLYGRNSIWTVLSCLAWGAVSYLLAVQVNNAALGFRVVTLGNLPIYWAPFSEEILKSLILIYLVRRPTFNYFVDGAICGFAVGIGFAMIENLQYITANSSAAMGVAIGRVLSTNLMHASASGIIGIVMAIVRLKGSVQKRSLLMVVGFAGAISLHATFNYLVTRVSSEMLILFAAGMGILATAFIVAAIRAGLSIEKKWIDESLGAADGVTSGEAKAVQQLSNIDPILAPLVERFGPEKGDKIQTFLMLQARIGILRKMLDKISDERLRKGMEAQLETLRAEMDEVRRSVGTYCMLYLRNIFPEDVSPLWTRLESQIEERAAAAKATPTTGGANLWASLGQRAAQPRPATEGSESPA